MIQMRLKKLQKPSAIQFSFYLSILSLVCKRELKVFMKSKFQTCPFLIPYRLRDETIEILAVFDTRQIKPEGWI